MMKDYYSSNRSVIELEELNLPVCPKWVKLRKNHSEKKSVLMLIICSSAVRALELIRSMTAFRGDSKVMKLFAKHIKVQEQVKLLDKRVVHLGVGTPGRVKELVKQGGLNLNPLKFLVFDWNWRDQKLRRMMDIPEGNVYMYYKLYGFYQNLYRYMLSRSNSQLVGKDIKAVDDCAPFKRSHNETPIAPCGAIANSMFNDTITLSYKLNSSMYIKVPMLKTGLTWWTDKFVKFQNPGSTNIIDEFAGTVKPPNWPMPIYYLDADDPGNNGFINEDFIVWMRTAAFATFKKLYRRLNRIHCFIEGLPAGNYSLTIAYSILSGNFSFWG
ncbi:Cell cycle control protein 50C [Tupaia chinensis]|uniref:Cell cycle control protein 50C n=1 Tax=Tupaia chinensis TaxID=246437 RepID=L9L4T5_TUPCH|nr:Cell cycle control protein 50C [Tupaia chinensis]